VKSAVRGGNEPVEAWTRAAYGLLAPTLLTYALLASRPGGALPLFLWRSGRDLLFLIGVLLLAWAGFASVRKPPFAQARRLRPLGALALSLFVLPYPFPYPSSHERRPSTVEFRLPVEGEWRVVWGGGAATGNHPAKIFAEQRWALSLEHPSGEDCFGASVLAPAALVVVALRDQEPDSVDHRLFPCAVDGPRLGNRVVLQVAPGEYCVLAHLQQASVLVPEGSQVEAGEPLARIGSSGCSRFPSRPHLLLFLQDSPEDGSGEPIPWTFRSYAADGLMVRSGLPRGGSEGGEGPPGQVVRQLAPGQSNSDG
jgi:hypothetical protein